MSHAETLRKALIEHLESLQAAGVTHIPKVDLPLLTATARVEPTKSTDASGATKSHTIPDRSRNSESDSQLRDPGNPIYNAEPRSESPIPARVFAKVETSFDQPYATAIPAAERSTALEIIRAEVVGCVKCSDLARTRKQTVFGVGNPNTRICLLGEAPGADEDQQGEPFVGASGQLLNKIIAACKLKREDIYILNAIKCRPPGNRNPSDVEVDNCWHFAHQQLEIIQPEFIVCLGAVPTKALLKTTQSIGRLRGVFHTYRNSRVVVTYHPSYLLRTPSAKVHVWNDMKMLMSEMGVEL